MSLQIKEVAAPYTSSPDLRRFWEHDIRVARDANRATMHKAHDKGLKSDVEYVYHQYQSEICIDYSNLTQNFDHSMSKNCHNLLHIRQSSQGTLPVHVHTCEI